MSVYGVHLTRYGNLNNEQLYSMFRESSYSKLDESEKLDLLQETVNRDALERGEIGAPEVRFADLPANESGNASNGIINVNRDLAVNGVQSIEYNGQTIQHSVRAYNIESLNTVLHENIHCFQDQIIDGTINIEDAQKSAEYQSNSFTTSVVLQDGKYQPGSQYLTGETANGYYCYYFQATERDAFLGAEEKTNAILNNIIEKYGTELSFEVYAKSVEITGYHATEQAAIERFQNLNFERDLNQTLMNQYFGMNEPVDPEVENAVKAEMIATYQSLYQQITQTDNLTITEETKMTFDPNKPVSLEEYNATLSQSYAATYEHMKTDPTLSQEEFVEQASTMSEKYHEAIQEFQEAQDVQNGEDMNTNEEVQVSDDGIGVNDVDNDDGINNGGIDNDMDI